jgi:hypothetical protein
MITFPIMVTAIISTNFIPAAARGRKLSGGGYTTTAAGPLH